MKKALKFITLSVIFVLCAIGITACGAFSGGNSSEEDLSTEYTATFMADGREWEDYTLTEGDITINAKYAAIRYAAMFIVDDQMIDIVYFTVEDKSIPEPDIPEREYYTAEWEDYKIVAADITINAEYTPIEYTATFMADGQIVEKVTFTIENMTVAEPDVPEKDGYYGEWEDYTLTTRDITINAVYIREYVLMFDYKEADGGNTVKEKKIVFNSKIGELPDPEKQGFSFIGWKIDGELITADTVWTLDHNATAVACWEEFSQGLEYTLNENKKSYSVAMGECSDRDIVIPVKYNGMFVTRIKSYGFEACSRITSVKIPDSVTEIGDFAFRECYNLTSVTIGNGVKKIGGYAFEYCTKLIDVDIPDSVTEIELCAFRDCYGLIRVTLGKGVKSINDSAFNSCYKLVEVINKSNLEITKETDYYGCVEKYAMYIHDGESKIINRNGYLFITDEDGTNYLLGYRGDPTILTLPDNYNGQSYKIYRYAFKDCKDLLSITIPVGVTEIEWNAFQGCYQLVEVIDKSNLNINGHWFDNGGIGENAFYIHSGKSKIVNTDDYLFITKENGTNYLLGYRGDPTVLTLPDSYNGQSYEIFNNAFDYCYNLTSVTMGIGVTGIGACAFYHCEALTNIKTNEKIKNINAYAFAGCFNLTAIKIPDGVTEMGSGVFASCRNLISIKIPDSVTEMGNDIFAGCSSLTSIVIPNNVERLSANMFSRCSSLKSVTLGSSVKYIEPEVFYPCRSLTSINVDEKNKNYKSIDGNLYSKDGKILVQYAGGKKETSFTVPKGVTEIGSRAFFDCGYLKNVILPDGLKSIGYVAFMHCVKLQSINLPNSVTEISESAFRSCTSLISIVIPDGVTKIEPWTFYMCESLLSVTIGSGVTEIEGMVFEGCKLVEVINKSNLEIKKGEWQVNGSVGAYALYIHNGESKIVEKNGFLFITDEDGTNYLVGYKGEEANLTLPDSYNGQDYEIYRSAFYGRDGLISVIIPDRVKKIGGYAFYNCYNLTNVTIGNGVERIGNNAFRYCSGLKTVTIGSGVTSIGDYAFCECRELTTVIYNGTNEQWNNISRGNNCFWGTGSFTVKYNGGEMNLR